MSRTLFIIVGVLSILSGLYALFNPFPASVAAAILAGWAFLFLGAIKIVAGFRSGETGTRIWSVVIGILAVFVGIEILADPLGSLVSLTLMVAILLIASGLAKLIFTWSLRGNQMFWPMLISGAASLILGLIILRHFPTATGSVLGLLLGVELLSNGIAAISMSWLTRDKA